MVLPALQAAPYYDTSSGMADSEESTESMGREAEHSSNHEQESPAVAAVGAGTSKQQVAAVGHDKQQQQQQEGEPASAADVCCSYPMQHGAQSPSSARTSKKSRTEQCAGAR
jgi:hypothetical protein